MPSKIHPARILLICFLLATIVTTIAGIAWFCINKQSFTGKRSWVTPPEITGFSAKSLILDTVDMRFNDSHEPHYRFYDYSHRDRYFLISYLSRENRPGAQVIYGNAWIKTTDGAFPRKVNIDKIVYAGFDRKRECYEAIIISNIFEFEKKEDFDAYQLGYKYDKDPKKQDGCCDFPIIFDRGIREFNGGYNIDTANWRPFKATLNRFPDEPETFRLDEQPILYQHRYDYYDGVNHPVEYWPISDTIGVKYLDSAWHNWLLERRKNIDSTLPPGAWPWDLGDSARPAIMWDNGKITNTPGNFTPYDTAYFSFRYFGQRIHDTGQLRGSFNLPPERRGDTVHIKRN